ncbi:NF-kappa-B-repressing factor [Microcaecilia unicolor]|uniref:NF-kappa-B-repressing factor n=1 Tax=Microcaecilia unicolor TaxID=1415580 RepID=A0A6P7YLG4_9AMPH|nr:NF-kappa-B-repressing factor [Microcaecilia unicolor]
MAGALWRRLQTSEPQPQTPPLVSLEQYRQYQESDDHWRARKEFITRHLPNYPDWKRDQLLALSMVWSNHVFMGCRYGEQLMQNVLQMAEGIDVGEMPSYELVLGAKGTKRQSPTDTGQEPSKKQATAEIRTRPRFEPVHFVASTTKEEDNKLNTNKKRSSDSWPLNSFGGFLTESSEDVALDSSKKEGMNMQDHSQPQEIMPFIYDYDFSLSSTSDFQSKSSNESGNFMTKMEQNYSAKFESHCSTLSKNFRATVLGMWTDGVKQGRKGFGFKRIRRRSRKGRVGRVLESYQSDSADSLTLVEKKQALIKQLSVTVTSNLSNPEMVSDPDKVNYAFVLSRSIQACKTNPEYIYVPLKEIPSADLPKNKNLPADGYACEVRCQNVYITTGFSGSKNGSRDRAAEQAVKLLMNPVEVRIVQRKFNHNYQDDIVVCPCDIPTCEFPPALKQLEDLQLNSKDSIDESQAVETSKILIEANHWPNFVLTENASGAIGILNNSAAFNKMVIEYKYDLMPSRAWRCRVFLQDHCLAEGFGNKKTSKHEAAEEAVKVLRKIQSNNPNRKTAQTKAPGSSSANSNKRKDLKDLVVYENSTNSVCTLNDTAQFNKITVEYVFERLTDLQWKCKVFLENQFVAEAIDLKKNVKHIAAEEAVRILKRTQPTVINNLKKSSPTDEAISRNQIRGRSAEESYRQRIKEDNIGNQLLRKMGWTGGGLGKEGEGIAEPISVKEQFSREGLGLDQEKGNQISKRDIEEILKNYACSYNQEDLTFSTELNNDERKQIHQIAQKYGLKSKSHGQGRSRFLVVSRKRRKEDLIDQLKQEGQVGRYELVMPDTF